MTFNIQRRWTEHCHWHKSAVWGLETRIIMRTWTPRKGGRCSSSGREATTTRWWALAPAPWTRCPWCRAPGWGGGPGRWAGSIRTSTGRCLSHPRQTPRRLETFAFPTHGLGRNMTNSRSESSRSSTFLSSITEQDFISGIDFRSELKLILDICDFSSLQGFNVFLRRQSHHLFSPAPSMGRRKDITMMIFSSRSVN